MTMNPTPDCRYKSAAEILSLAHFIEDTQRMQLDQLSVALRSQLVAAVLFGFRPVQVIWPDGATAVMLIPAGRELPDADAIVRAYNLAKDSKAKWPNGEVSWN